MLKPGDRIGDWIIDSALGEGGMGAVFRVHSALSERVEAALKVMKPSADADARPLFVREAEALAALRHPAIVRVMGFAEDPARGLLYLVMELARGQTLRERLERGPMPLAEALRTFLPLAHGLEHAHAAGIYHRDLKPSNVILTQDGVRLVDFGIAAAAHDGPEGTAGLGTLAYLPPEVFRGERARPRDIDVYAFGLLLHEALVGRRVFQVDSSLTVVGATAAVGLRKLEQAALDPGPEHPEKLREQVRRATDPQPVGRPDIAEICRALESLVERRGGSAAAYDRMAIHHPPASPVTTDPTIRVPDPPKPPKSRVAPTGPMVATVHRPPPRARPGDVVRGRAERRSFSSWPLIAVGIIIALVVVIVVLVIGHGVRRRGAAVRATDRSTSVGSTPSHRPSPPVPSATSTLAPASPAMVEAPVASPSVAPPETPDRTPQPPAQTAEEPPATGVLDVAGNWRVVNRIQAATYAPYRGLRLTYRLRLRQDGDTIVGEGEKVSEDGFDVPPDRRTPMTVHGRVEGDTVLLDFVEKGSMRTSHGRFRWTLVADGRLEGRFTSAAASSRGISIALREP